MSAPHYATSDELTDIFEPNVMPHLRSKSVGNEPSIPFLSKYWYSKDSTRIASVILGDTLSTGHQQLDEVNTKAPAEDLIDWADKLDTTGLMSSAFGQVMTSKWDTLNIDGSHLATSLQSFVNESHQLYMSSFDVPFNEVVDVTRSTSFIEGPNNPCGATLSRGETGPWAEAEDSIAIEAPNHSGHQKQSERDTYWFLPQGHHSPLQHVHSSPSFDEESKFLSIIAPSYAQSLRPYPDSTALSSERPKPLISPPSSAPLAMNTQTHAHTRTRTHKRERKQSTPDAVPVTPGCGSPRLRTQEKKSRTSPSSPRSSQGKRHSAVEKKYRHNLNSKIAILRWYVPSLRAVPYIFSSEEPSCTGISVAGPGSLNLHGVDDSGNIDNYDDGDGDGEELDWENRHACRSTKANIIAKATEYISEQELKSRHLEADIARYRSQIAAFEALA
jgi:hypothetical protein